MQLPSLSFDPDTVSLVGRVCDEAWEEARSHLGLPAGTDARGLRNFVAVRLMAAVAVGQRDPERLFEIHLRTPRTTGCTLDPHQSFASDYDALVLGLRYPLEAEEISMDRNRALIILLVVIILLAGVWYWHPWFFPSALCKSASGTRALNLLQIRNPNA